MCSTLDKLMSLCKEDQGLVADMAAAVEVGSCSVYSYHTLCSLCVGTVVWLPKSA